jgi:hypothetical protein
MINLDFIVVVVVVAVAAVVVCRHSGALASLKSLFFSKLVPS